MLAGGCSRPATPLLANDAQPRPSASVTSHDPDAATTPPPPTAGPTPVVAPLAPAELDALQALYDAWDAGMKGTILVPHPVRCPEFRANANGQPLVARGALSGLLVSIDGFLREDMGVEEAVAALGRPVMCNGERGSGFLDLYLAATAPGANRVELETHDGALIGVVVELEKPVVVDVTALSRTYGAARRLPGPMDSHEAGSDAFSVKTSAFTAQLIFAHRERSDPESRRQVHQIIFRRSPHLRGP